MAGGRNRQKFSETLDDAENNDDDPIRHGKKAGIVQMAFSPVSSVRIRIAFSMGRTKILPSPILPVFAESEIAFTALSTMPSTTTISNLTLGRKSTVYSLPR